MYLQNIDCDSTIFPFLETLLDRETITEEDLYPFVDDFADTNVTEIFLNVGAQSSISPSSVTDDVIAAYERRTENGIAVDYTDILKAPYRVMKEIGIDPFAVWFRRIREIGRRSHISFRMNDCHVPEAETCWLRPRFFYSARENGWMNGERYGYYRYTLNYKHPEVRRFFLDYIREQALRYDADGIELDFMRECICFDYAGEDKDICVPIMNDFIRSVKEIVKQAEARHGHRMEITVRLPRDIEKSLVLGFDPVTWEREGLVDRIIPSPRFHGSDTHIPIAAWQKALSKTRITACIESLISTDWGMSSNGTACMTAETVRGNAASYLAQGSDGIYTFNLFNQGCAGGKAEVARDREVQRTMGTYEVTVAHPLRFVTICEDADISPIGTTRFAPLPCSLEEGEEKEFTLVTGTLPADKKGLLRLGLSVGTPSDIALSVNGKPVAELSVGTLPYPENAAEKNTACYTAPVALSSDRYTIKVRRTGAPVRISWVELAAF